MSSATEIMDLVEEYCGLVHGEKPFVPGQSASRYRVASSTSSDVKSLVDSALEFWLTTGRFNESSRQSLAQRVGVRYAMTVNSGSSANLVAFSALTSPLLRRTPIEPGDEVITAAAGFPTTVNPSLIWGMTPVFVDVDIPTYNIDARPGRGGDDAEDPGHHGRAYAGQSRSMPSGSPRSPRDTICG